jgi:mannose-6-phosphate isomerase-like protein (cupin superfamily)
MAIKDTQVHITRWQGGQHPTQSIITRTMKKEGLRPYKWNNTPNYRYAVRSHNYNKVLYVLSGSLELTLPDTNQRTTVKPGDRIDIPAGVRHGTNIGKAGVECVEAAVARLRR